MACSKQPQSFNGLWQGEILIQDKRLPLTFELTQKQNQIQGTLYNSTEQLDLKGQVNGEEALIDIGPHYAQFKLNLKENNLTGHWIRTNKENYNLPLKAVKTVQKDQFLPYESMQPALKIAQRWRVTLEKDKQALGYFKQVGSRVRGSILTTTGDYRYLDGFLEKDQLKLFGFDGVFSFVLEVTVKAGEMKGKMLAGKSYQADIVAVEDSSFKLADANGLTKITGDQLKTTTFTNISGEKLKLDSDRVKILQIFGSWCPNCIDETNFFIKWRQDNLALADKVQFVAFAFENFKSKPQAIKALKKVKAKLGMKYDLVLLDYDKSKKPEDFFPIDKNRSFPTTLYLGRDNKLKKVHTGFSGQATGLFFNEFVEEFNQTIQTLLREDS